MLVYTIMSAGHQFDFRNSIRFPLHLQVTLKTPDGEYHAKTTDISAGGILFTWTRRSKLARRSSSPSRCRWTCLGTSQPVLVMCAGRVVRCSEEDPGRSVAVVIDEYHFKRI